jgi:hypothetical protein
VSEEPLPASHNSRTQWQGSINSGSNWERWVHRTDTKGATTLEWSGAHGELEQEHAVFAVPSGQVRAFAGSPCVKTISLGGRVHGTKVPLRTTGVDKGCEVSVAVELGAGVSAVL